MVIAHSELNQSKEPPSYVGCDDKTNSLQILNRLSVSYYPGDLPLLMEWNTSRAASVNEKPYNATQNGLQIPSITVIDNNSTGPTTISPFYSIPQGQIEWCDQKVPPAGHPPIPREAGFANDFPRRDYCLEHYRRLALADILAWLQQTQGV